MSSLGEFYRSGVLRGDHGGPLERTELLDAVIEGYTGDYHGRVVVSPRRNGKSSSVALLSAFELLTKPGSFVVWVSGSGDQASDILEQKLRRPLSQNPQTAGLRLGLSRDRIVNEELGSVVQCITPSEVSAPGRTISLLIIDEARSVPEAVVEVLRPSAAAGKIFVTGSPGRPSGWFYRAVRYPGPRDYVREFHDLVNPSLPRGFVEEECRRLERRGEWGRAMARREWGGEWVDLAENPLVASSDVEACSVEEIEPFDASAGDVAYIGCDLSVSRDLTSLSVVAAREGQYRLVDLIVFDPRSLRGEIPLEVVERRLISLAERYRPKRIILDAYQGMLMAQRLERERRFKVEAIQITAAVNMEVFEILSECIASGRVRWARNDRLESELRNLEIRETESRWKVVDQDRRLHRDVAFSFGLALRAAFQEPIPREITFWDPEDPDDPRNIELDRKLAEEEAARLDSGEPPWWHHDDFF